MDLLVVLEVEVVTNLVAVLVVEVVVEVVFLEDKGRKRRVVEVVVL